MTDVLTANDGRMGDHPAVPMIRRCQHDGEDRNLSRLNEVYRLTYQTHCSGHCSVQAPLEQDSI